MLSIQKHLLEKGHKIRQEHYVNTTPALPEEGVEAVVVNGEGTMHNDRPLAMLLMDLLSEAQRRSIRTYLINSIYQNMSPAFDGILGRGIGVSTPEQIR